MEPREGVPIMKGWKAKMISRAYGAHANTWEAFAGFSAAVLMAVAGNKEVPDLLALCNAFLWVRVAYVPVYVLAFNFPLSVLRSSVYFVGLVLTLKVMGIAAGW